MFLRSTRSRWDQPGAASAFKPNFPEFPVGGAGQADSAPLRRLPAFSGDGRLFWFVEVKFSGDLAKSICVNEGREMLIAVLTHVDRSLVARASVSGVIKLRTPDEVGLFWVPGVD